MHSTIVGTIEYRTDGVGVDGIERFQITHFDSGLRSLRATSELHGDSLVRETLLTVDGAYRPQRACIALTIAGKPAGSGQYRMSRQGTSFRSGAAPAGSGIDVDVDAAAFGGHALQNDAWMLAAADVRCGDARDRHLDNVVVTSHLPNGADGPDLLFSNHHYRYIGNETVDVPAGRFATRHFEFLLPDKPSIHYWLSGGDYLLVRCRWELLQQSYELVELATSRVEAG